MLRTKQSQIFSSAFLIRSLQSDVNRSIRHVFSIILAPKMILFGPQLRKLRENLFAEACFVKNILIQIIFCQFNRENAKNPFVSLSY